MRMYGRPSASSDPNSRTMLGCRSFSSTSASRRNATGATPFSMNSVRTILPVSAHQWRLLHTWYSSLIRPQARCPMTVSSPTLSPTESENFSRGRAGSCVHRRAAASPWYRARATAARVILLSWNGLRGANAAPRA